MSYRNSIEDNRLSKWFVNDNTCALLREIHLAYGNIRGLKPFRIQLDYPITVVAGKNGSGKTTLLALAACAFHNNEDGFRVGNRKNPYYTFSDFLIQSKDEVPPDGIFVYYGIAHNRWASETNPKEFDEGVYYQQLMKMPAGKWNSYVKRIHRPVIFFGIDRVVPHSEKSVSKNYRASFTSRSKSGCEERVQASVSKVLGNKYEEFHFKSHSKYRLPFVRRGGVSYSGFNMGAGENALFEIFYNLHTCPVGTMAIIDEIELGLHQQAQRRLMRELKMISIERKVQIICTTHSSAIMAEIPPAGRFYIENSSESTVVIPEISAEFAAGKLSGSHSEELLVLVEDGVAADLLLAVLDHELRTRVTIAIIGSDTSVIALLAGIRKLEVGPNVLAVLDGDKACELQKKYSVFLNKLEAYPDKQKELEWVADRLVTLPGSTWPEAWMMRILASESNQKIADDFGVARGKLQDFAIEAELAGKHSEFHSLAESLRLEPQYLQKFVSAHIATTHKLEFASLIERIKARLLSL